MASHKINCRAPDGVNSAQIGSDSSGAGADIFVIGFCVCRFSGDESALMLMEVVYVNVLLKLCVRSV